MELDPPRGVGALELGMTAAQARPLAVGGVEFGLDMDGLVNAVSVWRPDDDVEAITYRGIPVFALPALEVVDKVGMLTRVVQDEDDEASWTAPDLLLGFWRGYAADDDPDDPQGYYFTSVLVARPAYYDPPSEAARMGPPSPPLPPPVPPDQDGLF